MHTTRHLLALQAYGITKQQCQVKVKVNDTEVKTKVLVGLDPTYVDGGHPPPSCPSPSHGIMWWDRWLCLCLCLYLCPSPPPPPLPCVHPRWEETFEFPIVDEATTKCSAAFFMDEKQIGDEQTYLLPVLIKGKPLFKAIIVPGGQVNMMFT